MLDIAHESLTLVPFYITVIALIIVVVVVVLVLLIEVSLGISTMICGLSVVLVVMGSGVIISVIHQVLLFGVVGLE